MALSLAVLSAALALAGGCADAPELGDGVNTYTSFEREGRLRIMEVDQELSRQAQAGSLDPGSLPPGRLIFPGAGAGGADQAATVPWVLVSSFFFTQYDIFYAEAAPAADGSFDVVFQMDDEQGRDNTLRLQRMTASMAAAAGESGGQVSLAVVYNEKVRAVLPVAEPIVDGVIRVTGLSREEAEEIVFFFPDRAYRYPEEGKQSKWER